MGRNIDDKLRRLRKERELRSRVLRSRSGAVEDAWEKINQAEDLSVKEKLQKLIDLTGTKKEIKTERGKSAPEPRPPLLFYENPYPLQTKYGKNFLAEGLRIKGDVLFYLGRDSAFEALDLSTALFIDLETTGLSGGTGTVPFLVGMGYYRNDRFNVAQYFLGELGEEERMIKELGQFFSEMNFQSVVSYNGKAFDLPLLETRFVLHRKRFALTDLPHLDLLFSARSLWKHKHESCRLFHLAQQIVEAERSEDIPSAEIPLRYFEFLRTGNFSLMEPVLYHNQEDILSLLGLVIAASKLFVEGREPLADEECDALDLVGVGKVLESAGHVEKSMELFQRALESPLPQDLVLNIKRKLSYHFKKNEDWGKAISLWQDLSHEDQLFCYRELAMYFEHRAGKLEDARQAAEEGLTLAINVSPRFQKDFEHRMDRLNDKIRRLEAKAGKGRP